MFTRPATRDIGKRRLKKSEPIFSDLWRTLSPAAEGRLLQSLQQHASHYLLHNTLLMREVYEACDERYWEKTHQKIRANIFGPVANSISSCRRPITSVASASRIASSAPQNLLMRQVCEVCDERY